MVPYITSCQGGCFMLPVCSAAVSYPGRLVEFRQPNPTHPNQPYQTIVDRPIDLCRFTFSERELTFAISCRPSVRLSVCNARAPYSAGWNFRQYFYSIWYLGHLLTSTENFTELSQGNPSVGGGGKRKRGSQM